MDQNLLLCLQDRSLQAALAEQAGRSGFKVDSVDRPLEAGELETLFPDILLIDMDLVAEMGPDYLRAVVQKFPSIRIIVLAGPEYQEELLFLTLKSGARAWIF